MSLTFPCLPHAPCSIQVTVVKAAEADSEAKFLSGQGIARQRQAIITGLRDSVTEFAGNIADVSSKDGGCCDHEV